MELVLIVLGAIVAGFVQGLSGFAFTMVAMAFWSWVITPQLAVPLTVYGSLIGQLMAFNTVRGSFDLHRLAPFLVGGFIGVPIGAFMLPLVDISSFKLGVGLLLTVLCPVMLFSNRLPTVRHANRLADSGIGLVGGFMSGLCGLSGPAPTLWSTLRGWDKHSQRAVFQYFNLCMHAFTIVIYAISGSLNYTTLSWFAIVTPPVIVSCIVGIKFYSTLADSTFRQVVLILLTVTGTSLLIIPLFR